MTRRNLSKRCSDLGGEGHAISNETNDRRQASKEARRFRLQLEWKTCLRAGVSVILVYLVIHYWTTVTNILGIALGAAFPLLLGGAIAYVANILMCFYERLFFPKSTKRAVVKMRRPICMTLAFASVAVAVVFLMRTILPELIACLRMLIERLPGALSQLYVWLDERFRISEYLAGNNLIPRTAVEWQNAVTNTVNLVLAGVGGVMGAAMSVVMTLFSTVVTVLLAVIFAIYLLGSKETLLGQVRRVVRVYAGDKVEKRGFYVLRTVNEAFHHFIVGQCTEALILGSLCILGMLIFRFPYAVMIGTLVGFTALIPIAGAYIAAAVGAFMIFTVEPMQAVWFLVFLIVLQQLEGNLIFPRVVGSSIGLPALWVLAAVTIGGGLFGIIGMLLGVPLAAAAYRLLTLDMRAREQGSTVFDIPDESER